MLQFSRLKLHPWSILPTFMSIFLFQKKLRPYLVSTKKLSEKLSYKKGACKLLVKLTPCYISQYSMICRYFYLGSIDNQSEYFSNSYDHIVILEVLFGLVLSLLLIVSLGLSKR